MSKWALSLICSRPAGTGHDVNHWPVVVEARSKAEAEGLGVRIARKLHPAATGWSYHHCAACPINNVVTVEGVELTDD